MTNKNVLLTILFIVIVLLSGCSKSNVTQEKETGFLQGKISIGPLCPVERFPPDPNCQPTQETYKAWPIAVWTDNKKAKIAQLTPNINGTFSLELAAGTYVVDIDKEQNMFGARNLPATVTIAVNSNTTFDIDIDTGIR